jgi:hypothetical protein
MKKKIIVEIDCEGGEIEGICGDCSLRITNEVTGRENCLAFRRELSKLLGVPQYARCPECMKAEVNKNGGFEN